MDIKLVDANYETLIFEFRGKKVMIDSDLAILYGVQTKVLKQQVKRNPGRFPEDFMFELTRLEKTKLVKNAARLASLKHSNISPMVFTEQGVSMLSSVLRSEKAIQVNIEIMRAFARYRSLLKENEELRKEVQILDEKLNESFRFLLDKIDKLYKKNEADTKRNPIGFATKRKLK